MLMLYFSGTGNSKYIAQRFCEKMNAVCHSIEETVDFSALITADNTIAFCYPIYGSCVPRIMREFVTQYRALLTDKRLIVFCTQMLFSGDGARALTDLLTEDAKERVLYAEHFNMPNNLVNFALFRVKNGEENKSTLKKADQKIDRVCADLQKGKRVLRGFSAGSRLLGMTQSKAFPAMEDAYRNDARTDADCISCGLCGEICPMHNLTLTDGKIEQSGNCTLCYRCVNACPKQAITVGMHAKPKKQYDGPKKS